MEKLGINAGFFIAQLINFGVIFVALAAAWPRILKTLDNRAARIAKSLEDARVAEQARANAERDAQKMIEERRSEGARLVEEARVRAEEQGRSVLEEARRDAENIRVKARQDAEEERNSLLGEVRAQVGQLAIAAAQQLIGQSLDQNRSQQLVADFFSKSSGDLHGLGDTIEVTSALPLTDAEKANVSAQTGAKNVTYKIDPAILGGLLVRSGDRVVDGSVRASLAELSGRLR